MHLEHGVYDLRGDLLDFLARSFHGLFPSRSSHLRGEKVIPVNGCARVLLRPAHLQSAAFPRRQRVAKSDCWDRATRDRAVRVCKMVRHPVDHRRPRTHGPVGLPMSKPPAKNQRRRFSEPPETGVRPPADRDHVNVNDRHSRPAAAQFAGLLGFSPCCGSLMRSLRQPTLSTPPRNARSTDQGPWTKDACERPPILVVYRRAETLSR
jgi:hypothetical protein